MLSNITFNSQQGSGDRQSLLSQGDLVYLYGDRNYTGILIRPVERTYPQKWTVQLEQGGYEAVNVEHISSTESQASNHQLDLPFGDDPEASSAQLQREIAALKRQNFLLQEENRSIKRDLDHAKQILRRAKDVSPIVRLSLKRILRLAHDACMDVQRSVGGWILRMGSKARKFRCLAHIWDVLSQDDFKLGEIFPEDKLIAIESILPPRPRTRPAPPDKRTFPLMRPEDIMRNRSMLRVKACNSPSFLS